MAIITEISEPAINELSSLEKWDVRAIEQLRPILEAPAVRKLGKLGQAGDDRLLLLLSVALTLAGLLQRNGRLQRTGVRMLIAQVVAKAAKELGKSNVDRTRPSQQLEEGRYASRPGNTPGEALRSFPSGHTASALAVARAFSREYPRYTKPVLSFAALIGVLQVPRRANYPGDVAAGVGTGMMAEKLADGLITAYEKQKKRRANPFNKKWRKARAC